MKSIIVLLSMVAAAQAAPTLAAVTHSLFQAVSASGQQMYNASERVSREGILLHNPADMLDPTADDAVTELFNVRGRKSLRWTTSRTMMTTSPSTQPGRRAARPLLGRGRIARIRPRMR